MPLAILRRRGLFPSKVSCTYEESDEEQSRGKSSTHIRQLLYWLQDFQAYGSWWEFQTWHAAGDVYDPLLLIFNQEITTPSWKENQAYTMQLGRTI